MKNETTTIKNQIAKESFIDGQTISLSKGNNRLIINYATNRATKDQHNRDRGLKRLEKQLKTMGYVFIYPQAWSIYWLG